MLYLACLCLICISPLTAWAGQSSETSGSKSFLSTTDSASVRVSPAEVELTVGETAQVEILIEDVQDLWGGDVRVSFDPAIVEVVDADAGTSGVQIEPGDFPRPDFVVVNKVDNLPEPEGGYGAWYAITQTDEPPQNGGGTMYRITLRGKAVGTSPLHIAYALLSTRDAEPIPVTLFDGSVTVTNPASGFYGTVQLNGTYVPDGTEVVAMIEGVDVAHTTTYTNQGQSWYDFDVPPDDPSTPEKDGGAEGDQVIFRIGASGVVPPRQ